MTPEAPDWEPVSWLAEGDGWMVLVEWKMPGLWRGILQWTRIDSWMIDVHDDNHWRVLYGFEWAHAAEDFDDPDEAMGWVDRRVAEVAVAAAAAERLKGMMAETSPPPEYPTVDRRTARLGDPDE